MSLNPTLAKSAIVAALGGVLFGFDTAVISGTTGTLTNTYLLSPTMLGVTVSSALWGTVFGSMLAGIPGGRFGRGGGLRGLAILFLVSALGSVPAWQWPSRLVLRIGGRLG